MLEKTEGDHIQRFAVELSQIDDPRWEKVEDTRWLYFRIIDDVKIGEIRATMSPQRSNYALNKPETLRLLDGKKTGKADLIVVVAIKTEQRRAARASLKHGSRGVLRESTARQAYDPRRIRRILVAD